MGSQYYAVNAKLKAMSAGFLDKSDYDALLEKNSVGEICGYLKNNTVYGKTLENTNEEEIHRAEFEQLLNAACYDDYIRIFRFMGLYERKVFNYYIIKKEIEYIKAAVKRIFKTVGGDEYGMPEPDEFLKKHTKVNFERLFKADDFYGILDACRGTGYYKILYRESTSDLKSEMIVMMLDIYYYRLLWNEVGRFIEEKSELIDLFGKKIDILNIMWVYRCKKYFNMPHEMIYTHIIPISYKMTRENLADIVSGDIDHLINTVKNTRYRKLFENIDSGFAEEKYRYIMHDILSKKFRRAKEPVTLAVAYILLRDNEIQNIKTIAEGKRYSSDPDSIKGLIVY
ncbi:MAG: V-type ATPase subunit [Oscillospiraceae bacterium]|nr:V-type ATPase subunit [Oscillospiraceae bacterium]